MCIRNCIVLLIYIQREYTIFLKNKNAVIRDFLGEKISREVCHSKINRNKFIDLFSKNGLNDVFGNYAICATYVYKSRWGAKLH